MSLSLIACQPRMLEPSNPSPSSKTSSASFVTGIVKVLPEAGKIHEPQVNRLDVLFATQCQYFLWSHRISAFLRAIWGTRATRTRPPTHHSPGTMPARKLASTEQWACHATRPDVRIVSPNFLFAIGLQCPGRGQVAFRSHRRMHAYWAVTEEELCRCGVAHRQRSRRRVRNSHPAGLGTVFNGAVATS